MINSYQKQMHASPLVQAVLQAINALNSQALSALLPEEHTYQNTSKEVFIGELEKVFQTFRNNGDEYLLNYPGLCANDACEFCGKQGYRFLGNRSNTYLDLVFITKGDEIINILSCNAIETEETLTLGERLGFCIALDDQTTFTKSANYWLKYEASMSAYEELLGFPNSSLNFEQLGYWLQKHAFTFDRMGSPERFDPRMKWAKFILSYHILTSLKSFYEEYYTRCVEAVAAEQSLTGEEELIAWVIRYERVYEHVHHDFKVNYVKTKVGFRGRDIPPITLVGEPFTQLFGFINAYKTHYEGLMAKYDTFTEEETMALWEDKHYWIAKIEAHKLSFHLDRRRVSAEIGVEIPLYLNGGK